MNANDYSGPAAEGRGEFPKPPPTTRGRRFNPKISQPRNLPCGFNNASRRSSHRARSRYRYRQAPDQTRFELYLSALLSAVHKMDSAWCG